jgi:hypothetical protein
VPERAKRRLPERAALPLDLDLQGANVHRVIPDVGSLDHRDHRNREERALDLRGEGEIADRWGDQDNAPTVG